VTRSRFTPPRDVPFIGKEPREQERFQQWLRTAFTEIAEDMAALGQSDAPTIVAQSTIDVAAGSMRRVTPPTGGMAVRIPAPTPANAGQSVRLMIEAPVGDLTVVAVPGVGDDGKIFQPTINGQPRATFRASGLVTLTSNGSNDWKSASEFAAEAPASVALRTGQGVLDAQYLLRSSHPQLRNARVADGSTEIDISYSSPGLISWFLKTASVGFSKLANLTGLSVLGRAANSSGVMAAITSTAARQVLRNNDAGTALEWGHPVEVRDSGADQGDVYALDFVAGTNCNLAASVAAGVATITPSVDLSSVTYTAGDGIDLAGSQFSADVSDFAGTGIEDDGSNNLRIAAAAAGAGLTGGSGSALAVGAGTRITVNANDVQLASGAADSFLMNATASPGVADYRAGASVAGAGLTYTTGGTLAVGAGTHITANANDVAVDVTSLLAAIDSTSIVVSGGTLQTAAVTGAISIAQNATASLFAGILDNGAATTDRQNLNFIGFTIADDAGNNRINITAPSGGGPELRLAGVDQTVRGHWNLINEAIPSANQVEFTVTDDAGNDESEIRALLPAIGNNRVLSNISGGSARPIANTIAAVLGAAPTFFEGRLLRVTRYTSGSAQTHTWLAGATTAVIDIVSSGGGGGSVANPAASQCTLGAGGCSGTWVRALWTIDTATATYTVGAGAAGNASGNLSSFTDGTDTISCPGGSVGGALASGTSLAYVLGGSAGALAATLTGSGFTVLNHNGGTGTLRPNAGGHGLRHSGTVGMSGFGAPSPFSGGGSGAGRQSTGVGAAGAAPGAGGGGACSFNAGGAQTGGASLAGIIVVYEYS
jgi:hypothetical protein